MGIIYPRSKKTSHGVDLIKFGTGTECNYLAIYLFWKLLNKMLDSVNVGNKGLNREEHLLWGLNLGRWNSSWKTWECKTRCAIKGVLGSQVQSPLDVTFLLNLFCSSLRKPLLPDSSILGNTLLNFLVFVLGKSLFVPNVPSHWRISVKRQAIRNWR